MAFVVLFRRGAELMHYRLGREPVLLGKSPNCDLSLPDKSLARHQGVILWEDGRYRFDDRSGKQTSVNGKPVATAWLKDRDYIDLGAFRAHFHDVELAEPADRASAVRTEVNPAARSAALPEKLWLSAQRPTGGEAVRVELGSQPVEVGTSSQCGLQLRGDKLASAQHCRVTRQGDLLFAADLGSTNGLYARGLRFQEVTLPLGERIRAGSHDLWVSASLPEAEREAAAFEGIVTQDPGMLRMFERLLAIAAASGNVLIHGETGTGKDLVARALHRRSPRAAGPYVPINCAGLTPELLASTLFGSEKGAFTGADADRTGLVAAAHGGTLFLDEIGDMPPDLQVKLLRTVESGEILPVGASKPLHVDVRFVAGSHRDLAALARTGRFREDLLYRLNTLPLEVPPLRQRLGDVPLLWDHFAREFTTSEMCPVLTPAVVERLKAHRWPGNVRELRGMVTRTLCLMKGEHLRVDDLAFDTTAEPPPPLTDSILQRGLSLDELKLLAIRAALQRNRGNRSKAAAELGIERTTLQRQIAEHGLEREGLRDEEEGE
ncbi:MAG TPA: sigma 54-interacting transcriptional regulator [Myxococcales bacterium]|nr:sigma 54-interacting transcriptional regulator [Myxococcales bacterium]